MNPIAFRLFDIDIRWYGILIAFGISLGLITAKYTCRIVGIKYDVFLDTFLISLPLGIVGARLYYVIFNFSQYKYNPIEILNIRHGGLAIYGGVILGLSTAFIYTKIKGINFISLADAAAPSIILAQAVGRWGNFFNSEAYGGPVTQSFISHFPMFIQRGMFINGTYYHPTFLYESMWNLLVFLILIFIISKFYKPGLIILSYIGLYSIGRFFIEGLRTDSLMLGPFRVSQLVSLLGFAIYITFLLYNFFKRR